jgi:hypothetical protein
MWTVSLPSVDIYIDMWWFVGTVGTHPEEEVQRVLDGPERDGLLPARQVNGQVVELLPFGHHFSTAETTQ